MLTISAVLQDGPLPYPRGDRLLLGLSTVQIIGIIVGTVVLLVVLVGLLVVAAKRFVPGCSNFKFSAPHDTQILVIEGPEEADSDQDDDDDDDDERESV